MSAQDPEAREIGDRIRALRGDDSQEVFAKKVGITRSALANYELGRTRPKLGTIERIANVAGVSPNAIKLGVAGDLDELLTMLGGKASTDRETDLTAHERALVRVLRGCHEDTVKQVVEAILRAIGEGRVIKAAVDPATFEQDVQYLMLIHEDDGRYMRGQTRDVITSVLARLAEAGLRSTE